MRLLRVGCLVVALAGAGFAASAQQDSSAKAPADAMQGMDMSAKPADSGASTKAFKAANDHMMQGMGGPMTGNADQDFVAGMLPHHQGAIDMAKVELQYGTDPALRRLAKRIIAAQEKEIASMWAWQAKHKLAK